MEEGLLAASFARPPGRGGPGAGRPAKRYATSDEEIAVSVPPRDYQLVAELLARAIDQDDSGRVREALRSAAAEVGEDLATEEAAAVAEPGRERATAEKASAADLLAFLAARGFAPYQDGDVVRLRNCPFHRLAQAHTELVCGMNLALLSGALARIDPSARPRLDPAPDRCCVAIATS